MPSHGFWIYDDALVMVESIGAELRPVGAAEIERYVTVWTALEGTVEFGADAHRVLAHNRGTASQAGSFRADPNRWPQHQPAADRSRARRTRTRVRST
ncbi:hypothetical protein [Streptacidiphilus neutrinimicus]|uniref:hypothetical protein n=1 Tax=Streptacidiphilus neutrinimicus TaxID=105420 RepID=UPI0005A933B9|nr:hypothetical protein [Streptacidiphilus neutrinimicus]